jgi:hypothetical protein
MNFVDYEGHLLLLDLDGQDVWLGRGEVECMNQTNQLSPWSLRLHGKPPATQLLKNLQQFHGTCVLSSSLTCIVPACLFHSPLFIHSNYVQ